MKTLLTFFAFVFAASAYAVDGLTVSTLTLRSTFECISVAASYTGDDNANATAEVEFKASSSESWLAAYPPYIDRRATINSNDNSANLRQARVSIVGLSPNTSYDVRVTWTDGDGVSGTNPVSDTISTRTLSPPLGGTIRYVDSAAGGGGDGSSGTPYNTIAAAVSAAGAGDTIRMKGDFGATSITKSGTAGAWIKFEQWDAALTIGGTTNSLTITGDYLWFYNFTVAPSTRKGVVIAATSDFIILDTLDFPDVGTSGQEGDAGVYVTSGASAITVKSCTFDTNIGSGGGTGGVGLIDAIYFEPDGNLAGGHVIADCVIADANWRDGIGGGGNAWQDGPVSNSDICRNTILGAQDDALECEGHNLNVRIWGNTLLKGGQSLLAVAPTQVGPLYVFRNYISSTSGDPGVKLGNNSYGPHYFFHGTFVVSGSGTPDVFSDLGGGDLSDYGTYRNNIVVFVRYGIYRGGRNNSYDYNLYWDSNETDNIIDEYNTSGSYATVAAFNTATGQEAHGLEADPNLQEDGTLGEGSPAIDAGVSIPNFNGAGSAWPNGGSGPDIGWHEVGAPDPDPDPDPPPAGALVTPVLNAGTITVGQI